MGANAGFSNFRQLSFVLSWEAEDVGIGAEGLVPEPVLGIATLI